VKARRSSLKVAQLMRIKEIEKMQCCKLSTLFVNVLSKHSAKVQGKLLSVSEMEN
jgi:hypothetical protein